MVELKTPVRHGEEDLWDIYDATGQKILGVYATDQAAGERIAADVIATLNEAAVLRSRLEEAELENKRLVTALELCRDSDVSPANEGFKTPRQHVMDCFAGHKTVLQKRWEWQGETIQKERSRAKELATTLAAIREKCEQAKNGSLRTTIRAIHKLASGGTT